MNDPSQTLPLDPKDLNPAVIKSTSTNQPKQIGRYRIEKVLGEGGFGRVYLAYDDQLKRPVAIKVPRRDRLSRPEQAEAYLAEARVLASLDHPNIVPVHDVGTTTEGLCYVVSKLIDGCDLANAIEKTRMSHTQAADLVATVAAALHYAHCKGLVHRDIKPGNILLDTSGLAYVADFGLALKEEDFGTGAKFPGTPAYMSPEQARGEGHRVDGRSDIFSLGVVFYELLTGRRPFKADSRAELLEQITSVEVRPPRQIDDAIPKELERICLKALSKRASERYTTAKDMADDLRLWLADAAASQPLTVRAGVPASLLSTPTPGSIPTAVATPTPITPTKPSSDSQPIRIVPKGLRSFDAHDADFFLELLPGPRDREGLPDSLRFWKTRIEEADPDNTFAVGLIYGPSGCGKSSLVKAGLLPHLSDDVLAVYVESTANETEAWLLNGLRKRCPVLPDNLGLKETLAALRRGQGIPVGKKVLIVLDQFEQWLHAKKEESNTELVQALRQCDGGRVQCIVMVRDDFWLAVSRFLRELEIRLLEGQNSALVDLFDVDHAKKVLAAFGRAFAKLPENSGDTNKEQKEFLNRAVSGLAQEGKVVCVRLALFAEMMKGKPWTPASLKEVGGAEGVGVTFLEETFSVATAPPEHRYHQTAARAILTALLPESGADIKGHMRSYAELLEASDYTSRPKDFADLLRILDSEIRLITPTDPEGQEGADRSSSPPQPDQKYYQLTHDYLVPSLRDWLTRKQKETRRGRAELLLADRAVIWNARPENRQLPSLRQLLSIRWLTQKKNWTAPQQKMIQKAEKYHAVRSLVLAILLVALSATGLIVRRQIVEQRNADHASGLVQQLLKAEIPQVPGTVAEIDGYRNWADPLLRDEYLKAKPNSPQQLHASLALLPVDSGQVEYLYGRLLDADPDEVRVLREALAPHKDELLEKLWVDVTHPAQGKQQQRLRAAAALAAYDPDGQRWAKVEGQVANDLVKQPAVYLAIWMDALRPVRGRLLAPVSVVFRDSSRSETERSLATDILADYAAGQPQALADLVMDAEVNQFAVLYPKLKNTGESGLAILVAEVKKQLPTDAKDNAKEELAKRQANAAVALLKMDRPEDVWPLLKHSPDPRVRSYLIDRLAPFGADPKAIVKRLDEEPDVTIQRALILSLGEFGEKVLSADERKLLTTKLQDIYRTAPDPGRHAAAEWLLRSWQQEAWVKQVNETWAKDKEQREKVSRAASAPGAKPQWYVNGQGQTLVVIPGPVEFRMGSPPTEDGRNENEIPHKERIERTFAIAAKPVTLREYQRFDNDYTLPENLAKTSDCPVVGTTWFQAAAYCNWLSKQEGIDQTQWCYETDPQDQVVKLKDKYLSLTGYRLPTEAEVEYATRAGAVTSRYFGETEDLLPKYAWYLKNAGDRSWPVGSKKPNDLGLFDMHGNVWCWCQERYKGYPQVQDEGPSEDVEDILTVNNQDVRVLRGGSFGSQASSVRSADRYSSVPTGRNIGHIGFRAARTLLLVPLTPLPPPAEGGQK